MFDDSEALIPVSILGFLVDGLEMMFVLDDAFFGPRCTCQLQGLVFQSGQLFFFRLDVPLPPDPALAASC